MIGMCFLFRSHIEDSPPTFLLWVKDPLGPIPFSLQNICSSTRLQSELPGQLYLGGSIDHVTLGKI